VLVGALKRAPAARVVLAHGGGVDLLRHAELVRHNDNLLLDLSFTLLKYAGSSIDADVAWLLAQFDRRVCVGSDHPEFTPAELRTYLDRALAKLPRDKAENVAHRNLARFLGRTPRPIPELEDA
jgi:predicted TIM-barrel fold metal-dependent hydrolase